MAGRAFRLAADRPAEAAVQAALFDRLTHPVASRRTTLH